MIPHTIHYCWFGGQPLPALVRECIDSWKRHLPDFEIKQWNESSWQVSSNAYAQKQWDRKKFAFVSDVCRLDVLAQEGGIYLDTDVVVKKSLAPFLHHSAFLGMMFSDSVGTAVIGAEQGHQLITNIRALYDDSQLTDQPNNDLFTDFLIINYKSFVLANTRQMLPDGTAIYPRHYFERYSNHPKKGYTQHLVTNTWQENSRGFTEVQQVTEASLPRLREFVSNARFVPRAAHFETFVKNKLKLKRPLRDDSLMR